MSELLDIQEQLRDTNALLAQFEQEVAKFPDSTSIKINIESLQKRKKKLEERFGAASERVGVDICSYRFLTDGHPPRLAGLASALLDYQTMVSLFYDAIKKGEPKQTTKISADSANETAFDFGYSFPGSVGFILTIPNERLLLIESNLDLAVQTIFELTKVERPEEILQRARVIGRAPIRVLYRWADSHVRTFLSADIEWRRGQEIRSKALIQKPEFERLLSVISATSEEESIEGTVTGWLMGADVKSRTFHLQPDAGGDIKGSFIGAIDESHTVEVPKRYTVRIRKTTKVFYSTEEERVSYELVQLEPA